MVGRDWISEYTEQLEKIRETLFSLYTDFMLFKDSKDGLSHVQTILLKYLLKKGRSTVSSIADFMGVTMAAVSSLVDRLVKVGFLDRERSETDRRVVYISLTPAGRKAIEESLIRHRERLKLIISKMGKEKAGKFLEAHSILLETLEQVIGDKNEQEVADGSKN
ncbi:MAG: MarR family transcriptional regulator [Peptococcaceae bacterium]|nr:MarR family transcriptional regulator [Peptococcaceae bacterium]